MANDGTKFSRGACRLYLLLLEAFFVVGITAICSDHAHISFDQTRKLQDDNNIAFTFKRVDGYDHDSDVSISKFHFSRFISCLQLALDRPCLMFVAFPKESNGVYHYTATIPSTSSSDLSSQRRRTYECTLPNSFLPTSQVECTEQFNLQECFNSSRVCSSIIPQYNNTPETIYNVIWKSRGRITFSYNKNVVVVEPCFKLPSDETNSTGVIVGVVFAVFVIVVLFAIVVIYWRRKTASTAKGLQHYQGSSSSVAIAASDQTDPSPGNAETSFSRNAYSTVNKAYSSPYEQVDTSGAGYSTVHTNKIESKDKNTKHGQQGNITKPDVWPSSTINQHLPTSAQDGTIHYSEPGHEYSKLHENKRNFTNPYNELAKPTEDSQRQPIPILDASSGGLSSETSGPYSLAKPFRIPNQTEGDFASHPVKLHDTHQPAKKLALKFKLKESPESASASDTTDSNSPENKEHKYFVLEKEDGPAKTDDAESKGREQKYFILEKGSENTETDN